MPAQPRFRRLSTKFLLFALPAIVVTALAFTLVLALLQSRELERVNRTLAEQQAERGAELLRHPVWNVDVAAIRTILAQLARPERVRCVRLFGAIGLEGGDNVGDCAADDQLARIERAIEHFDGSGVQQIGLIEMLVDLRVDRSALFESVLPLVYLLLTLVLVLTGCVVLAFRRTILTPLEHVARSIRAYRRNGERVPVDWQSGDELGEFIREYNDGLQRQEQAERGLEEQLAFQRALRNTLPTPFAFVDRQWQVFDANPAFHRLFRIEPEAQLALPLSTLLPGADWRAIAGLRPGGVHGEELTPTAGPLAGRTFLVGASPYLDPEGAIRGYVLVLQDISERIQDELALREAMNGTERALGELRQAQCSLVQAEKLASLGSLVAGIAHEINTPIGNGITIATALTERVGLLQRAFEQGELRRATLVEFLQEADEAGRILHRALATAAEQIQKFKQVAVDQASSQRRRFELGATVDEVLSTLRPQLKRTRHQLQVRIDPGIEMDSFPGPLGQVLVNCFTNALVHGFDGVESGRLTIAAARAGSERVLLTIEDSGRGIPPENLGRIFDPFFTTRLGKGGSGLGMNLVYTIVTGLLGGRVELHSAPGRGTRVTVDIPLCAPQEAHAAPEAVDVH